MDKATLEYLKAHKDKLQGRVLEVGSFNVNGGVREVIDVSVGIDMRAGRGVDLVCPVERLHDYFPDGDFDACVSCGTLEHVKNWKAFVEVTWDMVKEGGFLVLTIASLAKKRHNYPNDYWRMTEEQIRTIYPNMENYQPLAGASVGWTVKKEGELGSLDFEPLGVK